MASVPPFDESSALAYEAALPLRWSALITRPDAGERDRIEQRNEEILRSLYALDDYYPESAEEHGVELARLDLKLNLVLDLVGELLAYYNEIPKRIPVKLMVDAVEWEALQAPLPNSDVSLEIYLDLKYPRPIVLLGHTQAIKSVLGGYRIRVGFDEMAAVNREWLEKIIFRQHRRHIALARRHDRGD